jgi:type I restriction-modification system DNA methylase subunit
MSYIVARNKVEGIDQLKRLIAAFQSERSSFVARSYNETQLRTDFLSPLLKSFGWDVDNTSGKNQFLRDVIQEESIAVADENARKNPDYTLRVLGQRKLFIEAKKPAVDILNSASSAFQIRRYGWNAGLSISILSNFEKLIVYDCRNKPGIGENEHVSRVKVFQFEQYAEDYDQLYELISFESAFNGKFEDLFSIRIGQSFDSYFLEQIENWRRKLAQSAVSRNIRLTSEDVNFLIQRLLNRIVFLRICEDRTIEKHETLKSITNYEQLKALFLQSDLKYNSGLFNFIEDTLSLNIVLDSEVLIEIFNDLYYPLSPYDFTVVDPSILSQIYEKFLGSHVVLNEDRQLSIVMEPEVVASNGVVSTPKLVVEQIVKETLHPLIDGKSSSELMELKVADICCGSGTFLISAYDFLLREVVGALQREGSHDQQLIYEGPDRAYGLTFKVKREILKKNIFGVDINPYAAEVTQFSLLLKLLEDESGPTVQDFIARYSLQVLPNLSANIKCGNSLVDDKFYEFMPGALDNDALLNRVKPFKWSSEFPFLATHGGFDAIIGNPPYVRIQNLKKYSPEEILFYQNKSYGYKVALKDAVDKYFIFIERAVSLLNSNGYLGYIVPHKFFINHGGTTLRSYITDSSNLSKIIHFGVTQVFPDRSTYTAILILQQQPKEKFEFKRIKRLSQYLLNAQDGFSLYKQEGFNGSPWIFLSKATETIFNKLVSSGVEPLKKSASICVGVQTSKDPVYIFKVSVETDLTFKFVIAGIEWEVEKSICVPCILDLSFSLYDHIKPNAQMIFPYHLDSGRAVLYTEKEMVDDFPLCWNYLNANKAVLEKRSINGKEPKWYEFGRSQSLSRFQNTPKLIWPVLSTQPSYIYDEQNIMFTGGGNGPYYSLINNSELSIFYFLGIMAHPVIERLVKAGASEFRGAYYSHGKQFIENLPIKIINLNDKKQAALYQQIVDAVKELILARGKLVSCYGSNRQVMERKIEILNKRLMTAVNTLYGITDAEVDLVVNDEMFVNQMMDEE